jgi:hypothetical protein
LRSLRKRCARYENCFTPRAQRDAAGATFFQVNEKYQSRFFFNQWKGNGVGLGEPNNLDTGFRRYDSRRLLKGFAHLGKSQSIS